MTADRWRLFLVAWTVLAFVVGMTQGWGLVSIGALWLVGLVPLALVRVIVRKT